MQLRLFFRPQLAFLPSGIFQGTCGKHSCQAEIAQVLLLSVTSPSYPTITQQNRAYLFLTRELRKNSDTKQVAFALLCLSLHSVLLRS